MKQGYCFVSNLFQISQGEDEETNPGCYGRELGEWLSLKLKERGYAAEDVFPEDWGWCVVCAREDYLLWVGCGTMPTEESLAGYDSATPPKGEDVIWHVFPVLEVPFFYLKSQAKRLVGKLETREPLRKLNQDLQSILDAEPGIERCDEP